MTRVSPLRASARALSSMLGDASLRVVFQPIVDLSTSQAFAYEALVRCPVPEFENPEVLMRGAHEQHCIGRLGRTIREIAVPLGAGERLFVNVHPMELDSHWLARPDDPIFFHDREVYVEVTEDVSPQRVPRCFGMLREIRARGVHIVIDDLGAGYSNLRWLAELEPSMVKIDKSIIREVEVDRRRRRLVAGIVNMCVDLGAKVVAEGIEQPAELRALEDAGVHYGQGYLFARPGFPLPSVAPPPAGEDRK